jgi:hypothetical protein
MSTPLPYCRRCLALLVRKQDTVERTAGYLLAIFQGTLYVRCRACRLWCPLPDALRDLLLAKLHPLKNPLDKATR